MTCDEILTRLAEDLTEAGRELSSEVQRHLVECAECSAQAASMRAVIDTARELARPESEVAVAPPRFEEVLARTRSPARRARRGLIRAAVLLLAVLVGVAADRIVQRITAKPAPAVAPLHDDALRRELAARPGGLGGPLAVLAALERRR